MHLSKLSVYSLLLLWIRMSWCILQCVLIFCEKMCCTCRYLRDLIYFGTYFEDMHVHVLNKANTFCRRSQ